MGTVPWVKQSEESKGQYSPVSSLEATPSIGELQKQGLVWSAEVIEHASSQLDQQSQYRCLFDIESVDSVINLPFGATHEWFYQQKSTLHERELSPHFLVSTLALKNFKKLALQYYKQFGSCSKCIAFIGKQSWPSAFLLNDALRYFDRQQGTESSLLSHVLLLDPRNEQELFWVVDTALRSQAIPIVVSAFSKLPFPKTRRLLLSAKKNNTLGFFFLPERHFQSSSAAYSRWKVSSVPSLSIHPNFKLELLHSKGKQSVQREWELSIHSQSSFFMQEHEEKISLHLSPTLAQRSSQTESTTHSSSTTRVLQRASAR